MRIESEYDREERRARAGVAVGVALLIVAVGFGLLVRFRPDVARALVPLDDATAPSPAGQPPSEETATLQRATSADSARPTAAAALPTMFALLQDTTTVRARSRGRRAVITDVVLLPCSTPNPRPDGSIVIPPHNPRHRTIVGLPPGDPPRGFVVPPHNPDRENEIPIQIIPMDSILAHTLRVPPHDPTGFNVVRPDTLSCLLDSSAAP